MCAITNKQRWRIVRKAGNCSDAAFHHSCGGSHTNSQSLLSQPITLIWALTSTNLITNLFLFSYKCGTGFNGKIAEESEGQGGMRMRERDEEVDSARKKIRPARFITMIDEGLRNDSDACAPPPPLFIHATAVLVVLAEGEDAHAPIAPSRCCEKIWHHVAFQFYCTMPRQ
ncbi:hypothetical protein LR48_Vigan10g110700 [Vigna angularis]|uniref:Uncharacterized protein n=1 Tax=Phaseolus angularis TaxID=3914 RepID=A0A0L9VJJ0_PHAAN|nr:hypothetical protein LR48_Vigan10g110700 [Vigna angularis]